MSKVKEALLCLEVIVGHIEGSVKLVVERCERYSGELREEDNGGM
jgi:hypothetical protein